MTSVGRGRQREQSGNLLWNLLTFERLVTGPVIHLVYWAGLAVIVLMIFTVIGTSIGLAIREGDWVGILLAVPILVAGLLVVGGLLLVWRSFCEFYVAIFRIADDLRALRQASDADHAYQQQQPGPPRI